MAHFTNAERSELSILHSKGYSDRQIGVALGRHHTTIGREIKRNSSGETYDPRVAKAKARRRRRHSKYQGMKVRERPALEQYIIEKLGFHWTPEEISGRLKQVDTNLPYISTKGIYKWLYSAFGQRYCRLLPKQRYHPRKRRAVQTKRVIIPNRIGIEKRHEGANKRSRFGHFEHDTMVSGRKTGSTAALSVLEERKARYTCLRKIPNMKPENNTKAVVSMGQRFRKRTSITYDNGIENRRHEEIAFVLRVKNFFCNSYHSWEKGSVENTIGRIRRFIPKGADINQYSDSYIAAVEHWLNHTPRKCLEFQTPYEIMAKNLLFISPHPSGAFEG